MRTTTVQHSLQCRVTSGNVSLSMCISVLFLTMGLDDGPRPCTCPSEMGLLGVSTLAQDQDSLLCLPLVCVKVYAGQSL